MLVLSRKPGEKVVIGGNITIRVVEVAGGRVRFGIEASDDVRILRGELACWLDGPAAREEPTATAAACRVARGPGSR
jgi:carbon storage regulator